VDEAPREGDLCSRTADIAVAFYAKLLPLREQQAAPASTV